jgi:methylenetetrahydrofolate dehydrogenase (NADP+)/methenyltetrahydrofolate cyclohydrolase
LATLLSGKELAASIRDAAAAGATAIGGRPPGLVVILAGDDPASESYVAGKQKACRKAGFLSTLVRFPSGVGLEDLLAEIDRLNADPEIDGILCQLPMPPHIPVDRIASAIDPRKDVDGFHPLNVGRLWRGEPGLVPCTPAGVMRLLRHFEVPIEGRRAVVIGRSGIVGKPMAALLLSANATVTIAHSRTTGLDSLCREADILVAAAGIPGLVKASFVGRGAAVVDVGISRTPGGLVGDVDFDEVEPACSYITPVPGGVGPLTIALLLENTLLCRKLNACS